MLKKIMYFHFIIILLLNMSCIDENIPVEATMEFQNSALLLGEFEERGDFINSNEFPALVDADTVYQNLDRYIIIDVRQPDEYKDGHITNSINVVNENLYEYVTNLETNGKKILLVSNTGQAAAYYLTLLRYAGIKNVYSLKFGIGIWNSHFAHLWEDNFNDFINDKSSEPYAQYDFNNIAQYTRPPAGHFPGLMLNKEMLSIDEIAANRINILMQLGFDEKTKGKIITENTVGIEYIVGRDYKKTDDQQ